MEKRTGVALAVTIVVLGLYQFVLLPHLIQPVDNTGAGGPEGAAQQGLTAEPAEPGAPEAGGETGQAGEVAAEVEGAVGEGGDVAAEAEGVAGQGGDVAAEAEGVAGEAVGQAEEAAAAEADKAPPEVAGGQVKAVIEVPLKYRQENLEERDIPVSTQVYDIVFTTRTGSVKSLALKGYKNFDMSGELVLLEDFMEGEYPTEMKSVGDEDLSGRLWFYAGAQAGEDGLERHVFETVLESGLKLKKTYVLYGAKYGFGIEVEIENLTDREQSVRYELSGPTGMPSEDLRRNDVQGVLTSVAVEEGIGGKASLGKMAAAAMLSKGRLETPVGQRAVYAGVVNRYFAAVLRPEVGGEAWAPVTNVYCDAVYESRSLPEGAKVGDAEGLREQYTAKQLKGFSQLFYTAKTAFEVGGFKLGAAGGEHSSARHGYLLYCGPKDKELLAGFDTASMQTGFTGLLDYGWFEPLVKVILVLLKAFHTVVPNWGVSIIILTFLMRIVMHPLTRKSQVSMAKMQKLQPLIKKLKEKHKNDKQKLGQEQMKLMKEAGANPLGGCLPMLLQLPIFFALYRSLMLSIELRHSPFFLWINDLAQPDRLAMLPFTLPLLGTKALNLLPILMAISMVVQQKMMPKPVTAEAAQQQKMMAMLMPVFIGFLLYNLASGLNLYIFTSTCFAALEQWWIRRHIAALDAVGRG